MCDLVIYDLLCGLAEFNQITVKEKPLKANYGRINGNRIAIKSNMSKVEKVYTLAHELAHYYLHKDKGNTIISSNRKDYEEQADRAALMLLDFMAVSKLKEKQMQLPTDQSKESCIQ